MRHLYKKFFDRDTRVVAQELLGKFLVRQIGEKEISAMIIETEAYDGINDKASHAFKGRTRRTETMFGKPGIFYVYLCYGMYFMLNVVTREQNYPAAVLIRGAIAENRGILLDGPGKITKFLAIDKSFNGQPANNLTGLWFEEREIKINKNSIQKTARIGVNYAGPLWSAKKLRFLLKESI